MGQYSKLVGALTGNVVAILLAWAAVQFPQFATCIEDSCTILGFSQAQITAALMVLFNSWLVYQFPANKS